LNEHNQSSEDSVSQISLTDPDSRAMAAYTKVGVGYNVQIAVDAKNKMIVEQAVTNDVLDMGLLQQTAEPARQILDVETINVVADKGYFKSEDIAACEKAGLTWRTLPLPGLSPVSGKTVITKFDDGLLSSDGGVMALREVEQHLRVAGTPF
jgi:Transposase DDE domain